MSRVGKKKIIIPPGVEVKIEDGVVVVKGPEGELKRVFDRDINIAIQGNEISIEPRIVFLKTRRLWGTYRSIIANMIEGVAKGFVKRLQVEGVGYRAEKQGNDISLKVGFSHPVVVKPKAGIIFEVEKNIIIIKGADKEIVGNEARRIIAIKPPDPYKGKGIRPEGKVLKLKPGKRVAAAGTVA